MATPFKMKGNPMQRNYGIGSPLTKKEDKKPDTVEVPDGKGGTTTYENPYKAYQWKNVPKADKTGAPVAGPKVYSSISGLQVSGPDPVPSIHKKSNVERSDDYMKGKGKSYWASEVPKIDSDKSGLPDAWETAMSPEIRNLGDDKKIVKKKKKSNKKMDYAKSQLTLKKK